MKNGKKILLGFLSTAFCFGLNSCDLKEMINDFLNKNPIESESETQVESESVKEKESDSIEESETESEVIVDTTDYTLDIKEALFGSYKDFLKKTADFEMPVTYTTYNIFDNKISCQIEWDIVVHEGGVEGAIVKGENNGTVQQFKVMYDAIKSDKQTNFDLIGYITYNDYCTGIVFDCYVPRFDYTSFADFLAAEKGADVNVSGYISGIIAKSKGNTYNCLYMQNEDGGYYIYSLSKDPVTDLGLSVGDEIIASGTKDIYSGTLEVANATITKLSGHKDNLEPADYTEIYKNATSLKDTSLVEKQSYYVQINGVEVTGENTSSGYYKFKLGELESYVRISSSVCPLVKADQDKFKADHLSHFGWTANVSGVICLYDGAFYLTPITVNSFEYAGLPPKSDADAVSFVTESLQVSKTLFEDSEEISVDTKGYGEQVSISWASNSEQVTFDNGKMIVTLGETGSVVELTATITAGESTQTKTFAIELKAAASENYLPEFIEEAVAGTYKFGLYQAKAGVYAYFNGKLTSDGKYLDTTDKAINGVDVTVEAIEGGYYLTFMDGEVKKYIDMYLNGTKVALRLAEEATEDKCVWAFNDTFDTFITTVNSVEQYLGCYSTYTTMSASKLSYVNADNCDVTQFPARCCNLKLADYDFETIEEAAAGTYKFGLYQAKAGVYAYFNGKLTSDGKYLDTTDKITNAVDVTVEAIEGGYYLSFVDGEVKKYIDMYLNGTKVALRLAEETTEDKCVWAFNDTFDTFIATVNSVEQYLGCYSTYTTMSASKLSYVTADNCDVTQFPARCGNAVLKEIVFKGIEEAVAGTYKFGLYQAKAGVYAYFNGKLTSDGKYLDTTDKYANAADVTVEAIEGGYYLTFMDGEVKKYIDVYLNGTKVALRLAEEATEDKCVWTFNDTFDTFITTVNSVEQYLGCYSTYTTMSASKLSYVNADNCDVTQFPARCGKFEFVKEVVEGDDDDDDDDDEQPVEPVVLNASLTKIDSSKLPTSYQEAVVTYNGINFSLYNVANFGNGVQIKKADGYFTNTSALANNITSVEFKFTNIAKTTKENQDKADENGILYVYFSATNDFTNATMIAVRVEATGDSTVTINCSVENAKFFKFVSGGCGAVYCTEININHPAN